MSSEDNINFDEQGSNIERVDSKITIDSITPHIGGNGKKMVAQIRSVVTSTYPEAGVGNSLNDSIFGEDDFGFGQGKSYPEKRVAWIDVPAGTTVEALQAKFNANPQARIYKILSLQPVLTDEQKRAMQNGLSQYADADGVAHNCDMEYYKQKQRIPTPETASIDDPAQHEPLLYRGYPQYRVTAFSKDGKQDVDMREQQYAAAVDQEAFKMNEAVDQPKVEYAKGF